jgi:DNA-directed RNA polymerase subunit RPC12/RpoP
MTDKLYHCKNCGKDLWRFSRKKRIESYCTKAGKKVWLRPQKTVRVHLNLPIDTIQFLKDGAERIGVGPNEFFNMVVRQAIEMELQKKSN